MPGNKFMGTLVLVLPGTAWLRMWRSRLRAFHLGATNSDPSDPASDIFSAVRDPLQLRLGP